MAQSLTQNENEQVRVNKCVFCQSVWFPNVRTKGHDVVRCSKCGKYQIPKSIILPDLDNMTLAAAKELSAFGPLCDLSKELRY